jgi:hypothetical protein
MLKNTDSQFPRMALLESNPCGNVMTGWFGYGIGTIEQFREVWRRQVATETGKRNRAAEQGQLFK